MAGSGSNTKVVKRVLGWSLPVLVSGMLIISACNGGGGGSNSDTHVSQVFATGWVKEDGKRIADPSAFNPDIVEVPGGWRMYFEREDPPGEINIYSAFSDDGLAWTEDLGIRVADANMPGSVKRPDGRIWLCYKTAGAGADNSFHSALSDAADGLDFTPEAGIRLSPGGGDEDGGIRHPCVIHLSGTNYRLFYDATDSGNIVRIKTAHSADDGQTWTKQGVVVEPSDVMAVGAPTLDVTASPGALIDSLGLIRLFFSTSGPNAPSVKKGVYMATSTDDGATFTVQAKPIVSEFTKNGQAYGIQDAAPVFTDDGLRLYYWIGTSEVEPLSAIYSVINASLEY